MPISNGVREKIIQDCLKSNNYDGFANKMKFIEDYNNIVLYEYEGRNEDVQKIMSMIKDTKSVRVMVLGETQTGKTYVLLQVIANIVLDSDIPAENIFILTGLSSRNWVEQTKDRIPKLLEHNIFHLGDLKTRFKERLQAMSDSPKELKNIRILIDECQVASTYKNTISSVLHEFDFTSDKFLKENNIKIIEFSATPDATAIDIKDNTEKNQIYILRKMDGYTGFTELKEQGRLKNAVPLYVIPLRNSLRNYYTKIDKLGGDYPKLGPDDVINVEKLAKKLAKEYITDGEEYDCDGLELELTDYYDNIDDKVISIFRCYYYELLDVFKSLFEVKKDINDFESKTGNKSYIIMRTGNGYKQSETIKLLNEVFDGCEMRNVDQTTNTDLRFLNYQPPKTTFVLIKEILRCSQTLPKKYNSVYYERIAQKTDDTVIAEGLGGRATGYDDTGISTIYTNTETCDKYINLIKNNFNYSVEQKEESDDDETMQKPWSAKNISHKDGKARVSRGTYNRNADDKLQKADTLPKFESERHYEVFKTFDDVKEFIKTELHREHKFKSRAKDINKDGFYVAQLKKVRKVYTVDELLQYNIKELPLRDIKKGSRQYKDTATRMWHQIVKPAYMNLDDPASLRWVLAFVK